LLLICTDYQLPEDLLHRLQWWQQYSNADALTCCSNSAAAFNPFGFSTAPTEPPTTADLDALVANTSKQHLLEASRWPQHLLWLGSQLVKVLQRQTEDFYTRPPSASDIRLCIADDIFCRDINRSVFTERPDYLWDMPPAEPVAYRQHTLQAMLQRQCWHLPRLRHDIDNVTLHISHSWGGGIQHWIENYSNADQTHPQLILKSEGFWKHKVYGSRFSLQQGVTDGAELQSWFLAPAITSTSSRHPQYQQMLEEICQRYNVQRIMISSLIGHSLDILRLEIATVAIIHDYYPAWPVLSQPPGNKPASQSLQQQLRQLENSRHNLSGDDLLLFNDRDASGWHALTQAWQQLLQQKHVALAAPSQAAARQLQQLVPELAADNNFAIHIIEHGFPAWPDSERARAASADPARVSPNKKSAKGAGKNKRRLRLVMPGRLMTGKGLELIYNAWPLLQDYVHLTLLGCGRSGRSLLGLPHIDVIMDYAWQELPALIAQINPDAALLLSTVSETYSYTLTEMQALNLPIIATRRGSFPDRIEENHNGLLIEPEPEALQQAVLNLQQQPKLLAQLRRGAQASHATGMDKMLANYEAVWSQLQQQVKPDNSQLTLSPTPFALQDANNLNLQRIVGWHVDELNLKSSELATQKSELLQRAGALKQQREELQRQKTSIQELRSRLDERIDELNKRAAVLKERRKQLQQQQASIKELRSRVQDRNNDLAERTAALKQRRQQLEQQQASIKELRARVQDRDGELAKRTAVLKQRRQQLEQQQASIKELRSRVQDRNNDLAERTAALKQRRQQLQQQQKSIKQLRARVQDRDKELAKRTDLLADQHQQLQQQHESIRLLRDQLQTIQEQNQQQQTQIREQQKSMLEIRQQLAAELQTKEQILSSRSWRITKPLRVISRTLANARRLQAHNPLRWPRLLHSLLRTLLSDGLRGTIYRLQRNPLQPTTSETADSHASGDQDTSDIEPDQDQSSNNIITPSIWQQSTATGNTAHCILLNLVSITNDNLKASTISMLQQLHDNLQSRDCIVHLLTDDPTAIAEHLHGLQVHTDISAALTALQNQSARISSLLLIDGVLKLRQDTLERLYQGLECGHSLLQARPVDANAMNIDPLDPRLAVSSHVDHSNGQLVLMDQQSGKRFMQYWSACSRQPSMQAALQSFVQDESSGHQAAVWQQSLATFNSITAPDTARQHTDQQYRRKPQGCLLVVDVWVPMPDKDSGSLRMVNMLKLLVSMGWRVIFVPMNLGHAGHYTEQLQQDGIEIWYQPFIGSWKEFLQLHGPDLEIVMLSRLNVANELMQRIHRFCPHAKVIYDTVDLHYLREQRQAELQSSIALRRLAKQTKQQELKLMQQADMTLVVSIAEQRLLRSQLAHSDIRIVSNIHEVAGCQAAFKDRSGVLFIGGFQHPPNIDAAVWLAEEIWPQVTAQLPQVKLHLIGSNATEKVHALASDNIIVHGFVEQLEPWLDAVRCTVAPLRYGAGVKGKINSSMGRGVPVVATSIGAEGMFLEHGRDVLLADDSTAFAAAIVNLHEDSSLWHKLSSNAVSNVEQHFSMARAKQDLHDILQALQQPAEQTAR